MKLTEHNPLGFPLHGEVVYFHCASPQTVKRWAPWARRIARGVEGGCLAFETIRDHRRWHRAGRPIIKPPEVVGAPSHYHGMVGFSRAPSIKAEYPWATKIVKFAYDDGYMAFEYEEDIIPWKTEGFQRIGR